MPDWFYHTISRPVLFRLSAARGRDLALGLMGRLARLPLGKSVIHFLGHMRADARLRRSHLGIDFPTAVGLGPDLDTGAVALPALAQFGVGFLEVGPVTVRGVLGPQEVARREFDAALWFPDPPGSLRLDAVTPRLTEAARLGVPLMVRLGCPPAAGPAMASDEGCQLIAALAPYVQMFASANLQVALTEGWSMEQWRANVATLLAAAQASAPPRPILWCVPADVEQAKAEPLVDAALAAGARGLLVDGSIAEPGGRLIGGPARGPALERVRWLRSRYGTDVFMIAAGGVHEPEHALALRDAGADLVEVDSGLVYSGPGLPKRINEALLYRATRSAAVAPDTERPAEMSWLWTTLMGAGMFLGSILALVIAATRVVLPYDEAFAGMTRAELARINPRLLPFMAHDRVSLSGTMVAVGVMYVGLSLWGIRQGQRWAQLAVFVSAFTGFASFFLFLGFEYLDMFHAFVTLALLQCLLLGVHARLGTYVPTAAPALRGDHTWRRGLWGQLLLILHGCGLLGAGATIATIGVTHVFVHEDLNFLQTTLDTLRAANPRLLPLVAHDRATFGGMLLASGWVFLLPALWGFRNGSAWLWWTMLTAGLGAYAAAIGVHFAVGYTDVMHLLPACAGLGIFLLGLGLSYSWFTSGR